MAIDTAEKRRSISGVGYVGLMPGVLPNASKDAEWRRQAGWCYSGLSAIASPYADPTDGITFACIDRFVEYGGSRIGKIAAIDRFIDYNGDRVTELDQIDRFQEYD